MHVYPVDILGKARSERIPPQSSRPPHRVVGDGVYVPRQARLVPALHQHALAAVVPAPLVQQLAVLHARLRRLARLAHRGLAWNKPIHFIVT